MADWFFRAFGEAIADIRQNVIEQPWFGRDVSPDPGPFQGPTDAFPSPDHQRSLRDWLDQGDGRGMDHSAPDPAPDPSAGHDFDR